MRKAFLTGTIGKDPEVFNTSGEWSKFSFSIANNDESKKDANGNYESVTSWLDLVYWTKKPATWINKLKKGVSIAVECEPKQETWTDSATGGNRSKVVFNIVGWPFEGKPREQAPQNNTYTPPQTDNTSTEDEDDIPF